MRIVVVAVGAAKGVMGKAVADYETRLGRYWKLEVRELAAGVRGAKASPEQVRQREAERILKRLPSGLDVVALTRRGTPMGSKELAGYLEGHAIRSSEGVAFVLGGAFGLAEQVLKRASRTLSLSSMTLPHEMARMVLAEQLYRAGTIVRGEPYHKG